MTRPSKVSPEVRERAVRMVLDHRAEYPRWWATITSIAPRFGCSTETLRNWGRQSERDVGAAFGADKDQLAELKELRRKVAELRRVNEFLRKASAHLAQAEIDRQPKR